MKQIIPDNENIEDYFDEDEIDILNSRWLIRIWNTWRLKRCIEWIGWWYLWNGCPKLYQDSTYQCGGETIPQVT